MIVTTIFKNVNTGDMHRCEPGKISECEFENHLNLFKANLKSANYIATYTGTDTVIYPGEYLRKNCIIYFERTED